MVKAIRNVELALGDGIKRPSPSEARKYAHRTEVIGGETSRFGKVSHLQNIT